MLQVSGALFVDQAGIHQGFIAFGQRRESGNQVAIRQGPVGARAFRQCETESEEKVLTLVEKLLGNLDFGKQGRAIQFAYVTGILVFTRLLQIGAIAGTIERHLALFAATLGADTPVHGWTEALFFSDVADGAAHWSIISCSSLKEPSSTAETQRPLRTSLSRFLFRPRRLGGK